LIVVIFLQGCTQRVWVYSPQLNYTTEAADFCNKIGPEADEQHRYSGTDRRKPWIYDRNTYFRGVIFVSAA
jgi:hypothetical protein